MAERPALPVYEAPDLSDSGVASVLVEGGVLQIQVLGYHGSLMFHYADKLGGQTAGFVDFYDIVCGDEDLGSIVTSDDDIPGPPGPLLWPEQFNEPPDNETPPEDVDSDRIEQYSQHDEEDAWLQNISWDEWEKAYRKPAEEEYHRDRDNEEEIESGEHEPRFVVQRVIFFSGPNEPLGLYVYWERYHHEHKALEAIGGIVERALAVRRGAPLPAGTGMYYVPRETQSLRDAPMPPTPY